MTDRDGIDPLYDLGPLPGGDILFRPSATEDVLGSALAPLPSSSMDAGPLASSVGDERVTAVGADAPGNEPPVSRSRPAARPPAARRLPRPAASSSPASRRIPPPQTYRPGPSPQQAPPAQPTPTWTPPPPVDLRRGPGRPRPASPGPGRPPRNPYRPGPSAGGSPMTLLRWALRHPRLAFGAAFAVVALVGNAIGAISGSEGSGGDPYPTFPSVDSGPVLIDAGSGEMSYHPELVPGSVTSWRIVVDNQTDGDADYRVEDDTTGELLGSGTSPAGASAVFTIPVDRLDDRISVVQDPSVGSGTSSCHVLADDIEVGTAGPDAAITCIYDPASLQR